MMVDSEKCIANGNGCGLVPSKHLQIPHLQNGGSFFSVSVASGTHLPAFEQATNRKSCDAIDSVGLGPWDRMVAVWDPYWTMFVVGVSTQENIAWMSQIPSNSHWLVTRGVSSENLLATGLFDDRWYAKPAPLFLPKGHY